MSAGIFAGMLFVLLALGAALSALGLHPLAWLLFPVPVAYYWAQGARGKALGLTASAAVAGYVAGDPVIFGLYLGFAGLGLLTGWLMRRRFSLGWCIGVPTALLCLLPFAGAAADWEQVRLMMADVLSMLEREVRASGQPAESQEVLLMGLKWMGPNWSFVYFGIVFNTVLLTVTAAVCAVASLLRQLHPESGPSGSFAEMRVSEWLVWALIAVALLWFVDYRWHHPVLRAVSWSGALALFTLYWLNGLSMLLFALQVAQSGWFWKYLAVVVVFLLELHPVVAAFGLFDTWWDFRAKLRVMAAARREEKLNE